LKYLLSIYCDEAADAKMTKDEGDRLMKAYYEYTADGREHGVILAGDPLHPSTTATTIRVREGKLLATDGPYAETEEQLGGYYLVDCKDLDDAIGWASRIPHAALGAIEVRPVMVFS